MDRYKKTAGGASGVSVSIVGGKFRSLTSCEPNMRFLDRFAPNQRATDDRRLRWRLTKAWQPPQIEA